MKEKNTFFPSTKTKEGNKFCLKAVWIVFFLLAPLVFVYANENQGKAMEEQQQNREIKGKVTDLKSQPIPGVTVLVKGTTKGAITDGKGNYSILVTPEDKTLVFSFVGMKTQEFAIEAKTVINVVMEEDAFDIEEVVAIGYGTMKKSDITGSVVSVKSEELKKSASSSFDKALQGRAAGVFVTQTTGQPGAAPTIRIRGENSISASLDPLIVVDGFAFPVSEPNGGANNNNRQRVSNILSTINPGDIESIEILKDASATAIYGSRGANGVILITTKTGESGKIDINFDMYRGIQNRIGKLDILNAGEYATLYNEYYQINTGIEPIYGMYSDAQINDFKNGIGETDWQNEINNKNAVIQNYQISVAGGSDKVRYYSSINYFDQDGIMLNTGQERFSIRLNLDADLTSKIKMGMNFNGAYTKENPSNTDGLNNNIYNTYFVPPTLPLWEDEASGIYFNDIRLSNGQNPVGEFMGQDLNFRNYRLMTNAFVSYEILEGLTFKSTFGIDYLNRYEQAYFSKDNTQVGSAFNGLARVASTLNFNWLNENTLNYTKSFDNHSFNALLGVTEQKNSYDRLFAGRANFVEEVLRYNNLTAGSTEVLPATYAQDEKLLSLIARLNYTYKNKYLVTLTSRRDGSSKFGANNKWAFFPSAAVGWRLSEEDFIKNLGVFDNLKLRGSYGVSGNQEIGNYQSLSTLSPLLALTHANNLENAFALARLPYPDLKWEQSAQQDYGIDIGMMDNRIQLTADYYNRRTTNMLLDKPIAYESGFNSQTVNLGTLENKGVELSLSTVNLTGKFKWNSQFNISFNRNKVLDLDGQKIAVGGFSNSARTLLTIEEGQPLNSVVGYKVIGRYQTEDDLQNSPKYTNAAVGGQKYEDTNLDGIIDTGDKAIIGHLQPKFTFGFTNNFSFRGFDASIFFQGVYGNKIANWFRQYAIHFTGAENALRDALAPRWPDDPNSNLGPLEEVPGEAYRLVDESAMLSNYVEDGSYLRCKNLTVGYTLPQSVTAKIKLKNLRVYLSADNLFTITNYSGLDPEVGAKTDNYNFTGVDISSYPLTQTTYIGVSINF